MTTDLLRQRAKALRLYGLLAHWTEIADAPWLPTLLQWEEDEHIRRSLERRMKSARLGRFEAIDEFDWNWPTRCDRGAIEAVLTLDFIQEAANIVLVGPNGVGKTMLANNIAHQALIAGHTVLCTVAGQLLGDLTATESDAGLRRRLRKYSAPDVLVIDLCVVITYVKLRHRSLIYRPFKRSRLHISNAPRPVPDVSTAARGSRSPTAIQGARGIRHQPFCKAFLAFLSAALGDRGSFHRVSANGVNRAGVVGFM
jgi:DNA replication protein DnaC